MLIDPRDLIATVKHQPENLDLDHVRIAGRLLERYESLLHGMVGWQRRDDGVVVMTFEVDASTAQDVIRDSVTESW